MGENMNGLKYFQVIVRVGLAQNGKQVHTAGRATSSSSCRAASKDIPDPLSPLLPIVHRLWRVFKAASRILT